MERKKWVVGNWKMNGSLLYCSSFLDHLQKVQSIETSVFSSVKVGLCLPYIFLPLAASHSSNRILYLGAQDVSSELSGAFTGEVSASMLAEVGAKLTLIGHSERRQYHSEDNSLVVKKVKKAINNDLIPLVCVGETLDERKAGKTEFVVEQQIKSLFQIPEKNLASITIAYEPVWAIGTGVAASAEEAQMVHQFIRSLLKSHSSSLENLPLLYGGSVNVKNASSFFSQKDIDGALLGGASLESESFIDVIREAASFK